MGLFSSGYTKHYDTQTSPLTSPVNVGESLPSCVFSSLLKPGSSLLDNLKDTSANSIAGRMYHLAKECSEGGKYSNIGVPTGTLIMKPLSKDIVNTVLGFQIEELISQKFLTPCKEFFTAYIYDLLTDTYQYDGTSIYVESINKYCTVTDIAIDTTGQICVVYTYEIKHGNGPFAQIETKIEEIETGINFTGSLDQSYLVIGYKYEDKIHYYIADPDTFEESSPLAIWYNRNKVRYYPSFFLRKNKNSIKRDDPTYFEKCCKALRRLNLDFEDIVDSANGEADLNNETDEDRDYRDSLKDVTDIALISALDITVNDQRAMRYFYEFFKLMGESAGLNSNTINYRHPAYNYDLSWDSITHSIKEGVIAPHRRFTTEGYEVTKLVEQSIGNGTITISKKIPTFRVRKQLDKNRYEEIIVSNLVFASYNNGHKMSFPVPTFSNLKRYTKKEIMAIEKEEFEQETSECLIPILPLIIQEKIGNIIGGDILTLGFRTVHNTYIKIKKKWYQSTWFTVIRLIIYVVIIVCTWGSSTPAVVAVESAIELVILLALLVIKIAWKIICKIFNVDDKTASIVDTALNVIGSCISPAYRVLGPVVDLAFSGRISLESITDCFGGIAMSNLSQICPVGAVAVQAVTSPNFYYCIQTHNWGGAVLAISQTLLSCVFTCVSDLLGSVTTDITKGVNGAIQVGTESVSASVIAGANAISEVTKRVSEEASKEASKSILSQITEEISKNLSKLLNIGSALEGISKVSSSYIENKTKQNQNTLKNLNSGMLKLSKLSETSQVYWNKALSANNSMILGVITDSLFYRKEYDFYAIAGTIKAPRCTY